MRLVIYSHYFAPSIGGVENIVRKLATGLAVPEVPGSASEFNTVVVTQTEARGFDDSTLPFQVVRRPGIFELARLIRDSDVLHIAGPALLPLFLARLFRKSVVVEHHGYQAICPNGSLIQQPEGDVCPGHFQARGYAACYRCQKAEFSPLHSLRTLILTGLRGWLCRGVENVAISHHVTERLVSLFPSQVIYYGIEDRKAEPVSRPQENIQRSGICFAYVGRFVSEKGIPVLLDAARRLTDEGLAFDLCLVGDGPDREQLQSKILNSGLDSFTKITGFLHGEALNGLLEKVDAVVMPSVCEETAGLAAIEQMMRGRLVIASSIGGLAEVVSDAGMLFAPRDVGALAACMKAVIEKPALVTQLGAKARQRALDLFTGSRMLDEHAQLYRRLADRNSKEAGATVKNPGVPY
ncbi:MAG: glycosyltransferase family 4 protein [Candidatus Acidiferrum sp.]